MQEQHIFIGGEPFELLHSRALYRPVQRQLILSDIHLGKASHFRKQGIAMPSQSHLRDIDKLNFLIERYRPETVLMLGDIFHSEINHEWMWFKSLLMSFPMVQFVLVEGNHDLLPRNAYIIPNLLRIGMLEERHIIFTHHPLERPDKLNICGHVHPGIRLNGIARQSMSLPCFIHSRNHLYLPAFGDLTGLSIVKREKGKEYYVVTGETVVQI